LVSKGKISRGSVGVTGGLAGERGQTLTRDNVREKASAYVSAVNKERTRSKREREGDCL